MASSPIPEFDEKIAAFFERGDAANLDTSCVAKMSRPLFVLFDSRPASPMSFRGQVYNIDLRSREDTGPGAAGSHGLTI